MKHPESIILAFANISKEYLDHLNFELHEIRDKAFKDAEAGNYIRVIEHNGTTYGSLSNLLNSDKGKEVTMLHYSGHSSEKGLLVQWKNQNGIIQAEPLSDLFRAHKNFRFIFLNSCYSHEIAKELVKAGIPYVIGTTDKIKDRQAALVASQFYQFLARPGKTTKEAFDLTKDYFSDPLYDGDALIKERFRSFQLDDAFEEESPWLLYESTALSDEFKTWTLIPVKQRNLLLSSNKAKEYKHRVFCVYEGENCSKLYKIISSYFYKNQEILIQGVNEISPDDTPNEEDIISECQHADVVVHLLSDAAYVNLWNEKLGKVTAICRQKYNIALAWSEDFEIPLNYLKKKNINISLLLPEPFLEFKSLELIRKNFSDKSLRDILLQTKTFQTLENYFKGITTTETRENEIKGTNTESEGKKGTPLHGWRSANIIRAIGLLFIIAAVIVTLAIKCPTKIQCFIVYALIGIGTAMLLVNRTDKEWNISIGLSGGVVLLFILLLINPIKASKRDACELNLSTTSTTVFVHGKQGRQHIVLRQGYVLLDLNGERKKESINEKGQATFQNLHIGDSVQLAIEFSEPYKSLYPDSIYIIQPEGRIYLPIALQGIDKVRGTVIYRDSPLEGVTIKIDDLVTTTDNTGSFVINIPEPLQKSQYKVWFIKKGFKSKSAPAYPQTGDPLEIVMEK